MNFYSKYIKYKLKYNNLKNIILQLGGNNKLEWQTGTDEPDYNKVILTKSDNVTKILLESGKTCFKFNRIIAIRITRNKDIIPIIKESIVRVEWFRFNVGSQPKSIVYIPWNHTERKWGPFDNAKMMEIQDYDSLEIVECPT